MDYFEPKKTIGSRKLRKAQKKELRKGGLFVPPVKRRFVWLCFLIPILLITSFVIYIFRDNQKIITHYVDFEHEQIPKSFDGFKILQITDLHGRNFGNMQRKLIDHINSLDYDIIIMTGDYLKNHDSDYHYVILDIIDNLEKDRPIYYILGDCDYRPDNLEDLEDDWNMVIVPKEKTPLMEEFDKREMIFVYPIQRIDRGQDFIFLTGIKYYEKAFDLLDFDSDKHFSITLTHKPIDYNVEARIKDVNRTSLYEVDFDANIAGHTIGGHVRLPILGPLYVKGQGFLPENKYTYGLSKDSCGRLKFISSGLGGFRALNNPEVAIITLKHIENTEVD